MAASDLNGPPSKRFKPDEKEGQAAAHRIGKAEAWAPTKAHRDTSCAPSRGRRESRAEADDAQQCLVEDELLGENFLAKRGVSMLSTGRRVDAMNPQNPVPDKLRWPNKVRRFK